MPVDVVHLKHLRLDESRISGKITNVIPIITMNLLAAPWGLDDARQMLAFTTQTGLNLSRVEALGLISVHIRGLDEAYMIDVIGMVRKRAAHFRSRSTPAYRHKPDLRIDSPTTRYRRISINRPSTPTKYPSYLWTPVKSKCMQPAMFCLLHGEICYV